VYVFKVVDANGRGGWGGLGVVGGLVGVGLGVGDGGGWWVGVTEYLELSAELTPKKEKTCLWILYGGGKEAKNEPGRSCSDGVGHSWVGEAQSAKSPESRLTMPRTGSWF